MPAVRSPQLNRFALLCACVLAAVPATARAQGAYPDKPIKLIVPQAPGSATDTVARILAAELGPQLGQTVIIENKPGAAFTIGLDLVAKAPPDGYTLGLGPIGALSISPNMIAKIPYSIEKDFQPVALVARGHLLLTVGATSEYKTVKDLIDAAKKNPGKMTNASSASGSPGHVGAELFKYMAGIEAVHVPYRGGAAATTDLIAGRVTFMFESLNSISPHAKSGAVRGLAVSGDRRSPAFPDVPTVAEAGVPGYSAPTWSGVIAPAGTPKAIVDKINEAVNKAIQTQAFKERFGSIGDEPAGGTPEEFANTIRTDLAKWKDVVQRSGAKLE
ncbi:MAG: tripartite tricarboxylate transporter substrate binding protein [Xanthobacteraceae bacterium]|nr:tripartite tricarboxylate transporter substrate binding protein [Xanthobacteraceae bacterium]